MPIANAMFSTWYEARMALPASTRTSGVTGTSWTSATYPVIVDDLKIKHGVNISPANDVNRGSADGHLWQIAESIWEINATILMATPLAAFSELSEPLFANYPTSAAVAEIMPIADAAYSSALSNAFISRCLSAIIAPISENQTLYPHQWSGYDDFLVRKVAIDVTESKATMTVSILSTSDPRDLFYLTGSTLTAECGWRLLKPYDLVLPSSGIAPNVAVNYVGGPLTYSQPSMDYPPTRAEYPTYDDFITGPGGDHISWVKEWHMNIDVDVMSFLSIGQANSRQFIAPNYISCRGNMQYVPIKRNEAGGVSIVDRALPHGWAVDSQSLEELERYGGKFYLNGMSSPSDPAWVCLFPGLFMRTGGGPLITIVDGALSDTPLGPILVASYELNSQGGGQNGINVEYQSNVGYDWSKYPIASA